MHFAHEEAAQRNDEEDAETSAGETDEDGLKGIGAEVKDVERGEGEDCARDDSGRCAADAGDDDILKQTGAALVDARPSRWRGWRWEWRLPCPGRL